MISSWYQLDVQRLGASFDTKNGPSKGVFIMQRRQFLSLAGTTTALAGWAGVAALDRRSSAQEKQRPKTVKMYVGTQRGPTTPQMLQYIKRHGVDHICG